jgi:hypothetical protein
MIFNPFYTKAPKKAGKSSALTIKLVLNSEKAIQCNMCRKMRSDKKNENGHIFWSKIFNMHSYS